MKIINKCCGLRDGPCPSCERLKCREALLPISTMEAVQPHPDSAALGLTAPWKAGLLTAAC